LFVKLLPFTKTSANIISQINIFNIVDKRFTSIEPEIGMRRIATNKDNDELQKAGLYLSKYKEKWERSVMKYEEE
jgi:hypothetical protein